MLTLIIFKFGYSFHEEKNEVLERGNLKPLNDTKNSKYQIHHVAGFHRSHYICKRNFPSYYRIETLTVFCKMVMNVQNGLEWSKMGCFGHPKRQLPVFLQQPPHFVMLHHKQTLLVDPTILSGFRI